VFPRIGAVFLSKHGGGSFETAIFVNREEMLALAIAAAAATSTDSTKIDEIPITITAAAIIQLLVIHGGTIVVAAAMTVVVGFVVAADRLVDGVLQLQTSVQELQRVCHHISTQISVSKLYFFLCSYNYQIDCDNWLAM
jgi:hypothetical protein